MTGAKKTTIKKVIAYVKPYIHLLILSIIFSSITVALTLYVPILIGKAIDLIISAGNVDFEGMRSILAETAVIVVVIALLQWLVNTFNNKITYQVVRDIRDEAFKKLEILPLSYIDSHSSGDIVSRIISDADQFADGLLMGFTQLFTGVVTIIGTLVFMLTVHMGITLLVVLLTPLSFLVARFIAKHTYSMFKEQSETRGEQTALIDEILGNLKITKAFSHEDENQKKFGEINDRLEKCSLKAIFYSSLTNPCTRFVNNVVYAAVALSGAIICVVGSGGFTVGALSAILAYANQYTKPFNEITGVITELQNAIACAARLFELIEETPQTADKENALVMENSDGRIELDDVSFSYTAERKLIQSLNLSVKSGQKIAIVGPTGCGKTTLINLLMRFYDVDNGKISMDGTDIRDITRHSLRSNYGMVLQETWLKAGTIRENIVMGKPNATEDEIITAAKAAYAHNFIKRLPNGYDTVIGEDGGSLSQGQKQLLCITRIMLCLPPILILDEATSSIDVRTEIKIQEAFNKLTKGRTAFIVAHRLSTIREADVILVMKDGNIIEQGSHDELLTKGGFYSELYNSQFANVQ